VIVTSRSIAKRLTSSPLLTEGRDFGTREASDSATYVSALFLLAVDFNPYHLALINHY